MASERQTTRALGGSKVHTNGFEELMKMNPAEEQARRDYEESMRQQRDREERERAAREARELEMRLLNEREAQLATDEARLRAQQSGPPNWSW